MSSTPQYLQLPGGVCSYKWTPVIWPVPHCSRVTKHSDCVGLLIVLRLALVQDCVRRQLILRREMTEVGRRSELAEERRGTWRHLPRECFFSRGSSVNTENANPTASWNLFEQLHVWLLLCAQTVVPTLLPSICCCFSHVMSKYGYCQPSRHLESRRVIARCPKCYSGTAGH